MSEPIKVGDLVQIVKPKPCCGGGTLGFYFFVEAIEPSDGCCTDCGAFLFDKLAALVPGEPGSVAVYRLRRVPPLSELEGERRDEKLTEPV